MTNSLQQMSLGCINPKRAGKYPNFKFTDA